MKQFYEMKFSLLISASLKYTIIKFLVKTVIEISCFYNNNTILGDKIYYGFLMYIE